MGTFHCPWTEDERDGALRNKLAIDLKAQAPYLDVFSIMPYHARFGHPDDIAWISRQTAWLGQHLGIRGVPGERHKSGRSSSFRTGARPSRPTKSNKSSTTAPRPLRRASWSSSGRPSILSGTRLRRWAGSKVDPPLKKQETPLRRAESDGGEFS